MTAIVGTATLGARQRVLDAVGEQCAVCELRHRIVERLMRELVLERLALAHVTAVQDDSAHVLVVQEVGVLNLEPQRRTVAVGEGALHRVGLRVARAVGRVSCASRERSCSLSSRSKRRPSTSSAR